MKAVRVIIRILCVVGIVGSVVWYVVFALKSTTLPFSWTGDRTALGPGASDAIINGAVKPGEIPTIDRMTEMLNFFPSNGFTDAHGKAITRADALRLFKHASYGFALFMLGFFLAVIACVLAWVGTLKKLKPKTRRVLGIISATCGVLMLPCKDLPNGILVIILGALVIVLAQMQKKEAAVSNAANDTEEK
jgi:hypothetical protein